MAGKLILIVAYLGGLALYSLLNRRTNGVYDLRTRVDRYIPFVPAFIIPYFGIFLFIPGAIALLFETPFAVPYFASLALGVYLGAVAWYLFPARMYQPRITGESFVDRLTARLYRDDPHANGFPSSHVINSTVTSYYLSLAFPHLAVLSWLIGGAIILSTVLIKHHRVADVFGGIAWAAAAIALVSFFS